MHVCGECGQRYEAGGFCTRDGSRLAESNDELLGTELGRYRIARLIGEGGMGRVYMGVQPDIGSRVAIKVLSDSCAKNPELLERFFAEARAVNLIRHESIVNVIDMHVADGRPFIVMELIEGETLSRLVRFAPAPLGGVVHVMIEVLSALEAAHAIGIVHRDLKPDNILVTGNGHAKVLDFGIAKLAPSLSANNSPRTRTGALLGTPAYMAPEQISGGGQVDARADIYAAGVVLFEAMTGRQPFAGATVFDLMRAHVDEPPPSPCALRPEIPAALEHVALTALAKQPEDRFQSAAAMANALEHAAGDLAPEQWQLLSRRSSNNLLTPPPSRRVVAARGSRQPTRPVEPKVTPPAHSVATAPRRRRRLAIGGGIAVVGIATLATAIALGSSSGGSGALQVASGGSEAAGSVAGDGHAGSAAGSAATGSAARDGHAGSAATGSAGTDERARSPGSAASEGHAGSADSAAVGSAGTDRHAGSEAGSAASDGHAGSAGSAATRSAASDGHAGSVGSAGTDLRAGSAAGSAARDTTALAEAPQPPRLPRQKPPRHVDVASADGGPAVAAPAQAATTLSIKPPFDPRRFDLYKFLPHARALARQLLDDAELYDFDIFPVADDGTVDLTQAIGGQESTFRFRSARRSTDDWHGPCVAKVTVTAKRVEAELDDHAFCFAKFASPPPCRFTDLWAKARTHGDGDIGRTPARLSFNGNGWTFSNDHLAWTIGDCR